MQIKIDMKKKLFLIISIILTLIFLFAGSFYWFAIRPAQNRKNCIREAEDKQNWTGSAWTHISGTEKSDFYRLCLVKKGMKPESLYIR